MDRKRAKELLPIIQAFAEGKTIQEQSGSSDWYDTDDNVGFDEPEYYFRIKPEPREFWVYAKDGAMIIEIDGPPLKRQGDWIKVREVLE